MVTAPTGDGTNSTIISSYGTMFLATNITESLSQRWYSKVYGLTKPLEFTLFRESLEKSAPIGVIKSPEIQKFKTNIIVNINIRIKIDIFLLKLE